MPAELYPQYTTVEYTLNRAVPLHPPTFLFVVDTCVAEDELHACKTAITQARTRALGVRRRASRLSTEAWKAPSQQPHTSHPFKPSLGSRLGSPSQSPLTISEMCALVCCVTSARVRMQVLQLIPEESCVGLITFGTHVHVHELGFSECSKCFVFRGSKEYTSAQVVDQLGLRPTAPRPGQPPAAVGAPGGRQFILPLSDANCETSVNNVMQDLTRDAYPVLSSERPARCTGTAMQARRGGAQRSGLCVRVGGGCYDATNAQGRWCRHRYTAVVL